MRCSISTWKPPPSTRSRWREFAASQVSVEVLATCGPPPAVEACASPALAMTGLVMTQLYETSVILPRVQAAPTDSGSAPNLSNAASGEPHCRPLKPSGASYFAESPATASVPPASNRLPAISDAKDFMRTPGIRLPGNLLLRPTGSQTQFVSQSALFPRRSVSARQFGDFCETAAELFTAAMFNRCGHGACGTACRP